MKNLFLISLVFIISSCATMIGPDVKTDWDCGLATAETKSANCSVKGDSYYYAKIFGTYSGPVEPVGYNEAAPHGWGDVIYNGKLTRVKFSYGIPRSAKIKYDEGSTFSGDVYKYMNLKDGTQDTEAYTYEGTFNLDGEHNRGIVTYKATNNKFSGSFVTIDDIFYPNIGTFYLKNKDCSVEYYGRYIQDTENKIFKLNKNRPFDVKHPFAKITKKTRSTKVDFTLESMEDVELQDAIFIDQKGYFVDSIDTDKKILYYNPNNGDISWSSFTWNNIRDCNSSPVLSSEDVLLDGVNSRVLITEDSINFKNLTEYGFIRYDYAPKSTNQLLLLKYVDNSYDRKITRAFTETSKYISGQREVYNSAYDKASIDVIDAREKLARARANDAELASQPCYGSIWECALVDAILSETNEAKREYEAALARLEKTPRTKIENIYSEYAIQKLEIAAKKSSNLKAILVDFDNGDTFEMSFPFYEDKTFTVINSQVAETDPNKKRLTKNVSTEKEVDAWMNKQFMFKENLINLLVELKHPDNKLNISSRKQYAYIDKILNQKNQTKIANTKTSIKSNKSYEIEDSILVIDTLDGMGTGFYVREDYVITNQHVVDESNFVNLRDMIGNRFTGQVIANDISTDLALIKVSQEGVALKFEEGCSVKRRENVFTVGHPKGYEYSTSRGIVSSIRSIENPFYKATGVKMYIQIDAPISSGNSGGPLFNSNEKVIGVNTWGRTDGQNLNFAVHCSEVQDFIDENI